MSLMFGSWIGLQQILNCCVIVVLLLETGESFHMFLGPTAPPRYLLCDNSPPLSRSLL